MNITLPRQVVQQALEAFNGASWALVDGTRADIACETAWAALRAAALEQPQAEPAPVPTQGPPVAKVVSVDEDGPILQWTKHWTELIGASLYTHPAPDYAALLSGDELRRIWNQCGEPGNFTTDFLPVARAIEAALKGTTP